MRELPDAEPDEVVELRSRVPPRALPTPLLAYLLGRFPYHDEATWRAELAAGRVFVDGTPANAETSLTRAVELCYRKPHREPPIARDIELLHVEPAFAVVGKPAHLPVHADGPFLRHTLIWLLAHEHGLADARLVHRLDRETSGLLVVARSKAARRAFEQQFRSGAVGKRYLATVHGQPPERFTCTAPIGHAARSTIALRRSAAPDARAPRPARTEFTVQRRGPRGALVACLPRTGRTHQIRAHLEHCGFPLVGDRLYGRPDDDYLAFVRAVKAGADPQDLPTDGVHRQLLHAAHLAFLHPVTGERLEFASPTPPELLAWMLAP